MRHNQAVVTAVLTTILRATADPSVPVVLRNGRPAQVLALAVWLERMHGSRRIVRASPSSGGPILVTLPSRVRWPDRLDVGQAGAVPLAPARPPPQFTQMPNVSPPPVRH